LIQEAKMLKLYPLLIFACLLTLSCGDSNTKQAQATVDLTLPAMGATSDLVIGPTGTLGPISPEVDFAVDGSTRGITIYRIWVDISISYSENGRNDTYSKSGEGRLVFGKQNITVDFPETRGGTISYIGHVTYQQRGYGRQTIHSTPVSKFIIGSQPPKAEIRKYLNDDLLSVVVFKRSSFEQFDPQGNPIFSSGFGLFRIPNPSAEQIWNWTKNAEFAKQELEQKKAIAKEIPSKLRMQDPVNYAGLPDFDAGQLLMEAVQSFGTGKYHKPKKSPLTQKWTWVKDSNNDGFAFSCEVMAKDVKNGKFPPGWN